eukprot:CAMPEP_0181291360 /NCGR_PEP_ID=MMETSP1101-20121128/1925_1 /TAXON_ID=46948 /ORGANISM="Rhodomonas abbreviata, Strain Caron Lab Isolate" /LENGTH=80 /DNA_ID=CAMNT_0023395745 /DNA_START=204 /DNA_END=443 /DNA_ORIENTATION=-
MKMAQDSNEFSLSENPTSDYKLLGEGTLDYKRECTKEIQYHELNDQQLRDCPVGFNREIENSKVQNKGDPYKGSLLCKPL